MHLLLTFLAGAVRYAGISADEAGPLRLVSLQDLLKQVAQDVLNPAQLESLAQALEGHVASGRDPLPQIDDQILELLAARPLSGRLQRVVSAVDDIAVLYAALRGGHVQQVELLVADRMLFDLIRSITVYQEMTQQWNVLVGTLGWVKEEQVRSLVQPSPLRQVGVFYRTESHLPYLNLSVGSQSNSVSWEASRSKFPHEIGPSHDLTLGMRGGIPRGQIKTCLVEGSWKVSNERCALVPAPKLRLKLVQTTVSDANGKTAMVCERVVG